MQADINDRMGPGYSGPQYGGAGLGAQNPVVPAGYVQQGNRYLSPGALQAQQAQLAAVDPNIQAAQDKIRRSGMKDYQQEIAMNQLNNQLAQSGVPGFTSTADKAANWAQRQQDINDRMGYTASGRAPAASQQNNPYDPKTMFKSSLANTEGVRRAEYMEARRKAEEEYYRQRNAAMARAQAGPGFSLGNLVQAMNPFAGVGRIASGEGKPTDYLKLAKFFL
jgi:hypothetical protein